MLCVSFYAIDKGIRIRPGGFMLFMLQECVGETHGLLEGYLSVHIIYKTIIVCYAM